jgi:NAD(P)-dependent dehydrogenase (short-subunit alcohol dehydrogenase family)
MNPTVLITGSNAGIGQAIATQLLANGYTVIGTARKPAPASFPVHPLDLTSDQSITELAATITQPIDILINNAGMATITPEKGREETAFENLSRDEFARILNVNAIGTFLLTRALLPHLRKGGRKLIVNISSNLGSIGSNQTGGRYAYRASKAALNMITKTLAMDLAPEEFTCIAWSPGWVRTKMGGEAADLSPEESAVSLCDLLPKIDAGHNGKFLNRQSGELPW